MAFVDLSLAEHVGCSQLEFSSVTIDSNIDSFSWLEKVAFSSFSTSLISYFCQNIVKCTTLGSSLKGVWLLLC